ncbi:alkaline phosphatase D family protein [Variovorax defluvii]|uniref:Alkaline phosphatase D family protein n=1 Tax=Variovorax defluvii TaxID=913761 RepID=A0ABP8GTR9_9BURK
MAWQSLAAALPSLPRVLCGPILRKVAPRTVSVWLATRIGCEVTLTVLDAPEALGATRASGRRHTVALGTQLHIVCVTATPTSGSPDLVEGVVYRYDLAFAFDDNQAMNLAEATGTTTLPAAFAYVPFGLPSFCLPPASLDDLRILCGSCRIPHGNGRDTFSIGDKLIAQAAANPLARPHQLLLTGDQIYADDVAASLLMVLSDAAHVLLGWQEEIPFDDAGNKATVDKLLPYLRREPLEKAGFTSEDLDGQLISLGEYLCMYLMVWSDVLWPADMPNFGDVTKATRAVLGGDADAMSRWFGQRTKKGQHFGMDRDAVKIDLFRKDLKDVRRMLANIPSYMIFDDHEVTDDWNMTRDTCSSLYGHPLGLRLAQNALVAYALCQHWGNVPEVFDDAAPGAPKPPGKALLELVDGIVSDSAYESKGAALRTLVGVHEEATLATRPANAVFHDEGSLLYHYTVEGPGHQVIFTDSRSWRAFPNGRVGGGVLIPAEQLALQIGGTPPTGERMLIVVMTTNAPPVEAIRSAARHDLVANIFEHYPDVYEAWELPSLHFDRLMVSLSDKLPLVNGQRTGALALVSGDVHFSFASRLLYKATTRLEDITPQPVKAVIAQLVASSFRKETGNTLGFQRKGYDFAPNWIAWLLIPKTTPQGYVGWNTAVGSGRKVGQGGLAAAGGFVPLYTLTLDQPTLATAPDGWVLGNAVDPQTPPDYSYRLDYLTPPEVTVPVDTTPIPLLPAGATPDQRKMAAEALRLAAAKYRMLNAGGAVNRVIGTNNFCEISFDWHPSNVALRRLHHTVRWRKDKDGEIQLSDYVVPLDPDDAAFPELVPRQMASAAPPP